MLFGWFYKNVKYTRLIIIKWSGLFEKGQGLYKSIKIIFNVQDTIKNKNPIIADPHISGCIIHRVFDKSALN